MCRKLTRGPGGPSSPGSPRGPGSPFKPLTPILHQKIKQKNVRGYVKFI